MSFLLCFFFVVVVVVVFGVGWEWEGSGGEIEGEWGKWKGKERRAAPLCSPRLCKFCSMLIELYV